MPAQWPSGLPQSVLPDDLTEQLPDTAIESPVEAGQAKLRQRYTAGSRLIKCSTVMTNAQAVIFETFFETTLAGGTLPFTWVHPRYRTAATFRFRKPVPAVTPFGPTHARIAMNLELLP